MGYVELDMRACRVQLKVNFFFSKVRGGSSSSECCMC